MTGFAWWTRDSWEMVLRNLFHIRRTPELLLDVTLSPINQCSLARNASMNCRVEKMLTPMGEALKEPFVRRERPSQLRMPS